MIQFASVPRPHRNARAGQGVFHPVQRRAIHVFAVRHRRACIAAGHRRGQDRRVLSVALAGAARVLESHAILELLAARGEALELRQTKQFLELLEALRKLLVL
jgi:hypothetical protein